MNKKISVIVPIYNGEKYLARCIESIINQIYTNLEIILIDDGSKDDSLGICYLMATKDRRIKVISNENKGVSWTRNIGLDIATGDYISFVDADDYLEPTCYFDLIYLTERYNPDIMMFNFYYEKNNKLTPGPLFHPGLYDNNESLLKDILLCFGGVSWNKFFKKQIIEDNHLRFDPKITFGEDLLFSCLYVNQCKICYVSDNKYYYYNQNNNTSLLHTFFNSSGKDSKRCFDLIEVYLRLKGILDEKFFVLVNQKIIECAGDFLSCLNVKKYPGLYKEYIDLIKKYYIDFKKHKKQFSLKLRMKIFLYRYFSRIVRACTLTFKKIFRC